MSSVLSMLFKRGTVPPYSVNVPPISHKNTQFTPIDFELLKLF